MEDLFDTSHGPSVVEMLVFQYKKLFPKESRLRSSSSQPDEVSTTTTSLANSEDEESDSVRKSLMSFSTVSLESTESGNVDYQALLLSTVSGKLF